jgi:hypothetical protein
MREVTSALAGKLVHNAAGTRHQRVSAIPSAASWSAHRPVWSGDRAAPVPPPSLIEVGKSFVHLRQDLDDTTACVLER